MMSVDIRVRRNNRLLIEGIPQLYIWYPWAKKVFAPNSLLRPPDVLVNLTPLTLNFWTMSSALLDFRLGRTYPLVISVFSRVELSSGHVHCRPFVMVLKQHFTPRRRRTYAFYSNSFMIVLSEIGLAILDRTSLLKASSGKYLNENSC